MGEKGNQFVLTKRKTENTRGVFFLLHTYAILCINL